MTSPAGNKYGITPFNGEGFSNWLFRFQAVIEENDCEEAFVEASASACSIKKKAQAKTY